MMANGKYVTYFRVSSRKQGKSGLGLEAQQSAAQVFLRGESWKTKVGEFVEVESGKRNSRPKLLEALALCRIYNATLIIAKLDRLARNVAFIANLMESGAEFVAIDMPTASKFTLHIMASVAEQEGDMIADRTKKALATARERGTMLGRRDGAIAAFSSIGFGRALAALLWMSIVLCAVVGTMRREAPFGAVLNHWDETAAYAALFALVSGFNQSVPA